MVIGGKHKLDILSSKQITIWRIIYIMYNNININIVSI